MSALDRRARFVIPHTRCASRSRKLKRHRHAPVSAARRVDRREPDGEGFSEVTVGPPTSKAITGSGIFFEPTSRDRARPGTVAWPL